MRDGDIFLRPVAHAVYFREVFSVRVEDQNLLHVLYEDAGVGRPHPEEPTVKRFGVRFERDDFLDLPGGLGGVEVDGDLFRGGLLRLAAAGEENQSEQAEEKRFHLYFCQFWNKKIPLQM